MFKLVLVAHYITGRKAWVMRTFSMTFVALDNRCSFGFPLFEFTSSTLGETRKSF